MEVSTSYCTQPPVRFKYDSFQESDDMSMMEEDICRFGSYNSQTQMVHHETFLYDGSIGEEEEASSCGVDENRDTCGNGQYMIDGVSIASSCYGEVDIDYEMRSECCDESDMTEESDDEEDVEDDEWTNQKNNGRNTVAYYAAMEMLRIRFPFQSISIRISDFCCLQEKDLLNDTMIDFYLNHIVEHVLPDNVGRKVTVLPSVFWHNLSLRQHVFDSDEENSMSEEQKLSLRFGDLHDFVEDFDLHDVDFVVIPVNEWEHWSLAVICHPFTPHARTVVFDSQLTADLNNLQNMASLLESFLQYSWQKRTGTRLAHRLPCVVPRRLPQQTNNFDCGVFVVEFAKCFLLRPPSDLGNFDFALEYGDFSVSGKRTEMQKAVLSLCSNRAQWRPLVDLLNGVNTSALHRAL